MSLKEQGKIRSPGVSANDWDPCGALGLIESGLTDTVQVRISILEQRPAERALPSALEHDVGIIVRVPFEEGLLTGTMGPDHALDSPTALHPVATCCLSSRSRRSTTTPSLTDRSTPGARCSL